MGMREAYPLCNGPPMVLKRSVRPKVDSSMLRPEKAEKAVSESGMARKWCETSEKDLSAAERRQVGVLCVLRRQKRLSRRLELSESGARRLKKTSQLLREGNLAGFAS